MADGLNGKSLEAAQNIIACADTYHDFAKGRCLVAPNNITTILKPFINVEDEDLFRSESNTIALINKRYGSQLEKDIELNIQLTKQEKVSVHTDTNVQKHVAEIYSTVSGDESYSSTKLQDLNDTLKIIGMLDCSSSRFTQPFLNHPKTVYAHSIAQSWDAANKATYTDRKHVRIVKWKDPANADPDDEEDADPFVIDLTYGHSKPNTLSKNNQNRCQISFTSANINNIDENVVQLQISTKQHHNISEFVLYNKLITFEVRQLCKYMDGDDNKYNNSKAFLDSFFNKTIKQLTHGRLSPSNRIKVVDDLFQYLEPLLKVESDRKRLCFDIKRSLDYGQIKVIDAFKKGEIGFEVLDSVIQTTYNKKSHSNIILITLDKLCHLNAKVHNISSMLTHGPSCKISSEKNMLSYINTLNSQYNNIKNEIVIKQVNFQQIGVYLDYLVDICKACKNTYFNMFRDVDFTTTGIPGFLQQYLIKQDIQIKSWKTDTSGNRGQGNSATTVHEDIIKVNMNLNRMFFVIQNKSLDVFDRLVTCILKYKSCITNFDMHKYDIQLYTGDEIKVQEIINAYSIEVNNNTAIDNDKVATQYINDQKELSEAQTYLIDQYQGNIKELNALDNICNLSIHYSTQNIDLTAYPIPVDISAKWENTRIEQLRANIDFLYSNTTAGIGSAHMNIELSNINTNNGNNNNSYHSHYIAPYLQQFNYEKSDFDKQSLRVQTYYKEHGGQPLNIYGSGNAAVTFIDIKIPHCIRAFASKTLDSHVDSSDGYYEIDIENINNIIKSTLEDETGIDQYEELAILGTQSNVSMQRILQKLFAFLKKTNFGRGRNSDDNEKVFNVIAGVIKKIFAKVTLHIDTYMGVLKGLTLKCGNEEYNNAATLTNAEKAQKGHPNYQEPLKQGQIVITPPNMISRFDALKAFIEIQKAKVLELVRNIREWYGRFIPYVGTNHGGGPPNDVNDVNDVNVVEKCRELSDDVLNLAILHDTKYLEEAAELIDDVFKAQYFTDDEKNEIIDALNISTEMNNMGNLVTCVNSILNKWNTEIEHGDEMDVDLKPVLEIEDVVLEFKETTVDRKKREGDEEPPVEKKNTEKKPRYFQQTPQTPQTPQSYIFPSPPHSSPSRSQTSADTQLLPPQSPQQSQQWPGGSPKTFKSSFFKDSAMPHWHSSASPFNQYATMKRLYRKNFKRFLLKYKMQE